LDIFASSLFGSLYLCAPGCCLVRYIGFTPSTLKIVYITYDGVREPLGSSQILAYLRGLRDRGIDSTIISFEKRESPPDESAEAGIRKIQLRYRVGGMRAHLANFRGMLRELRTTLEADKPDLIVARSYLPAAIALRGKKSHGLPYIFDMRGCWVDERALGDGVFRNPFLYKLGKRMERSLLRNAAGVVTLTKIHADELREQKLIPPETPVKTIPTCSDFDLFRNDAKTTHDRLVIGWIGSVNASYQLAASLALFEKLRSIRPDAFLQCVTAQPEAMLRELKNAEVPSQSYNVISAQYREMPALLARMDWGLLLNENGAAKRGSMPTKLAEFFAAGVRPIQYGCNQEVADLVRTSGSGIVLNGLSTSHLEQAARAIANQPLDRSPLDEARRRMRPYFGLEAGVAAYEEVLQTVCAQGRTK
jgi:glycosyltransferase involved in cell wall biosynthesis